MSKKPEQPITRKKFMQELRRYERGSVSRRHFLGVTGLGMATAVLGAAMPGLLPRKSWAVRPRPRLPTTTRSAPTLRTVSRIALPGSSSTRWRSQA